MTRRELNWLVRRRTGLLVVVYATGLLAIYGALAYGVFLLLPRTFG